MMQRITLKLPSPPPRPLPLRSFSSLKESDYILCSENLLNLVFCTSTQSHPLLLYPLSSASEQEEAGAGPSSSAIELLASFKFYCNHINSFYTIHLQHQRKAIMALLSSFSHSLQLLFVFFLFLVFKGISGATFTFLNKCDYTVWPGILGKPDIGSTGFELARASSKSFQAPTGWSGRFWARTDCKFDESGRGTCATGDCGSGQIQCNGAGATPPATLAEFTLGSSGSQDYYDVSLVDGFNLPMTVEASGGSGSCSSTGCVADLNRRCPSELRVEGGDACNSACGAFGKPEYCCNGEYGSPSTCKPSMYSVMFKSACPKSYSYAYDDATSTFTCTAADYTVTFCPSSPSLKSTGSSPTGTDSSSGSSVEEGALASTSWLANMATGASTRNHDQGSLKSAFFLALTIIISFLVL